MAEQLYWSKARNHQIANWVPEKKGTGGEILQSEESLTFENHTRLATTQKMQKFVEGSRGFKMGDVRKVDSMEEAVRLTALQAAKKAATTITASDESYEENPEVDNKIERTVGAE